MDFCLTCGDFADSAGVAKKDHTGHAVQAYCVTCKEPIAGGAHDGHHVVTSPSNDQILGVYYSIKSAGGTPNPRLENYIAQLRSFVQAPPQTPNNQAGKQPQ